MNVPALIHNGTPILNTCETCFWYRAVGDDRTLCCTVNAPQAQMTIQQGKMPDGTVGPVMVKHSFFPSPGPNWTCGKHRPKRIN